LLLQIQKRLSNNASTHPSSNQTPTQFTGAPPSPKPLTKKTAGLLPYCGAALALANGAMGKIKTPPALSGRFKA